MMVVVVEEPYAGAGRRRHSLDMEIIVRNPKGISPAAALHTTLSPKEKEGTHRGMRLCICTQSEEETREILRSGKIYRLFVLFHVRHLSRATPRSPFDFYYYYYHRST